MAGKSSSDTVEMDVFGPKVDHLGGDKTRSVASSSAVLDLDQLRDSEMNRCFPTNRPQSKKRRKSLAQSCGSLSSLASSFKSKSGKNRPNTQQSQSSVMTNYRDEIPDVHLTCSEENFALTPPEEAIHFQKNTHRGSKFFSNSCISHQQTSTPLDGGGGPSINGGTAPGAGNSMGNRFRTSIFSVLGKLGMWHKPQNNFNSNLYHHSDGLPPERGPPSTSSSFLRTVYICENERRIRANDRAYNSQFRYANNYIKTSKYSLLTFLPLNLLEQFQRLANFYFLCLLVLQLIPAISSLTPITTAIPLIGVLMLTAVKDAYDDIQRHMSDSQVNNRKSKTLRNGRLVDEKWSGVQVGDIIRMENNQFVAADILLLSSSEPNGLCFIETAELDGETNLKCKQCLVETAEMGQRDDLLGSFNGEIVCEPPNNLLNKFEGTLMWKNQRFSLDNEKILLRGCVLRNTQWCYGVVVFAGKDTKLMQNSGKTQFKSTSIDRLLNFIIIGIVFFLLSMCAFCTVACAIWESLVGESFQAYLPWPSIIPKGTIQGSTVIGLLVFFSYAIVLNTVVPISLYVSVEVIRFAQSFLINWDEKMYYSKTKTSAKSRTTTLNEELGQIQYIFSDKTGTLTQNIMTFNKCSINGQSYGDVVDLRTGEVVELADRPTVVNYSNNSNLATTTSTSNTSHNRAKPCLSVENNRNKSSVNCSITEDRVSTPTLLLSGEGSLGRSTPQQPISLTSVDGSEAGNGHDSNNNFGMNGGGNQRKKVKKQVSYDFGQHDNSTSTFSPAALEETSSFIPKVKTSANRGQSVASDKVIFKNATSDRINIIVNSLDEELDSPPAHTVPIIVSATANDHIYTNVIYNDEKKSLPPPQSATIGPSPPPSKSSVPSLNQSQGVHIADAIDFSFNPQYEPEFKWYDKELLDAVESDDVHVHKFFRLLALCHTVMPEDKNGRLEYQAQSPDESALVSAARNFGFVFKSRTPNTISIEVKGKIEEYELLSILDFNNVRKRMSVILRRNNKILLLCKGADSVIYDRLGMNQTEIKAKTQEHLNKFAGEGLRTLVLAEKYLDEQFFTGWRIRQQEAALSLDGREDKLGAIYEEIECDMMLVGVTAIEDKLQDGVPQAIANLQMAGIKIWVLTGDKQETAVNIGYSCQLLTDDLVDLFVVDGATQEEVDKQLRKFKESIKIVNTYSPSSLHRNNTVTSPEGQKLNGGLLNNDMGSVLLDTPTPLPPAISVVTFSAECDQLFENSEKATATVNSASTVPHAEGEESSDFAIVVNGHSLVYCLSPELEERFLDVASNCKAVICCRVTPLQKAMVVELIKRSKNAVTLAVGDGANDVSMIKTAHIGVGISGQEGMQAVLASDYSIAQFRYLERLLLVHGRWSYYRMCKFLRYFFYKNFAFTLCHFWYAFFCGFSAQTVFDPMFISVYNLFYTSLPVLALGVFEQDVSDKNSLHYPKLYTPGLMNSLFNTTEFIRSVLHGIFSSLVLFLIPYGSYKDGVSPEGFVLSDHMLLGSVVATILILDNTMQIALDTSYWTVFNHIMVWGSLISYFVLDYFYNYVIGGPYVGSLTQAMKEATFWFTTVITVIVLMVPILAARFYFVDVSPSLSDKVRLKQRMAQIRSRQSTDVLRTPSARRARRSLRSGYAFAHQEGFGRLITSGKIMRKLPKDFAVPLGLGGKNKLNNSSNSTPNKNANNSVNNNNSNNLNNSNNHSNNIGNNHTTLPGSSNYHTGEGDDLSPRAPCQDLDTINL